MTDGVDAWKEAAGREAAEFVVDGMRVGLGTGSTVHWTIVALGERRPDIVCAATSKQTAELATSLGLQVAPADELGSLDIAIDGADEVDPAYNLTKGGGGAQTREKIIATMARRFVVVVCSSCRPSAHCGPGNRLLPRWRSLRRGSSAPVSALDPSASPSWRRDRNRR